MTMAADVATLREFARPTMGMRTRYAAAARTSSVSPYFSAPTAMATGPV